MLAALPITATSTSRSDHGPLWRDIRDAHGSTPGALPGTSNAARTRAAIQAAVDSLDPAVVSGRSSAWGVVYIPGDPTGYYVDRPIWIDQSQLEIRGDGPSSSLSSVIGYGGPVLIHMPRKPEGHTLDTTQHLFDLHGVLDSSAASATGQRWGFRIKDQGDGSFDSVIATGPSPFSFGPCAYQAIPGFWATTPSFTIDFAVDWTAIGTHSGPYFGMTRPGTTSAFPFYCYGALDTGAGTAGFRFFFSTQNGQYDEGNNGGDLWEMDFSVPAIQAVHRIAIGIDLPNRLALAWHGDAATGTQVATTINPIFGNPHASFAGATGLSLVANTGYPFQLGPVNGRGCYNGGNVWSTTGTRERKFAGFRAMTGLWFANNGVGQPIVRADAGVLNDVNRYFNAPPTSTIAYFPMQDSPAAVAASRLLTIKSGDAAANGDTIAVFADQATLNDDASLSSLLINRVRIIANAAIYSEALVLARSNGVVIEDSSLIGGGNGISTWNAGTNYTMRISGGELGGNNAALYVFDAIVSMDDVNIVNQGRSAIWLNGSILNARNIFLPDGNPGVTEYVVRAVGGSAAALDHLVSDTEGFVPKYGQVYVETGGVDVKPGLKMNECSFAGNAYDTPMVVLHDATGIPGYVQIREPVPLLTYYRSLVLTTGPAWQGTYELAHALDAPPVENTGTDGVSGVRVICTAYIAPPRETAWVRGAADLIVTQQRDGQYGAWSCTGSGEYGTAAPPAWTGTLPADEGSNGLACYMTGHGYWSATGSGISTQRGFWTDYAQATALNLVLANAGTPTAPSSLCLGLADTRAQRYPGRYRELTGANSPGYARVAVGPSTWTASASGVASNSATITLPTPSADWSPARAVLLADASSGGNGIALIEIAPASAPLVVRSGVPLVFAPGALTVRPTAHTATRRQAWGPSYDDAINNYWLRAGTLTTPTLYLALSTAAADPTTGPTEPVGGSYARLAVNPATTFTEPALYVSRQPDPMLGKLRNAIRLTFATPTGTWGAVVSLYLMDAASGGNVIACGDLTIPRYLTSGSAAPTIAPGALWLSRS